MTTEIKAYKKLTTIQLFDWEVLTEATVDQLDEMLNNTKQFIRIWDEIVNKNQIKKIYVRSVDTLENFILSQPKDIQDKIRLRNKQKYEKVGKNFENIEQIQHYINTLSSNKTND